MLDNLNEKAIWDFNKEDTIYISQKVKSTGNKHTFLCQFERLVRNTVYGKVLQTNKGTEWDGIKVGDIIYANIKDCALYGNGVGDGDNHSHYHWFNPIGYAYKDKGFEKIDEVKEHPSFGVIGISRRSSSGVTPLFGSNIQHQHTFTLTIKTAENNRHLNNNWYHGKKQLIEVELSGSQFIELITSLNMGDGVPCTIRNFNGHEFPDPPYENPIDLFQKEFSSQMKNLGKECSSVVEDCVKMLKEKQSIGKADREFIVSAINKLVSTISSTVPFVSQQFNESMEKTVNQAKSEIETFVTSKIMALGIDVAKTNPDLFLGTKIEDSNIKKIDNGQNTEE